MKRFGSTFAIVIISMLAGAAIIGGFEIARDDNASPATTVTTADRAAPATTNANGGAPLVAANDFSQLYEQVRPSVVRISTGGAEDGATPGQPGGTGSGIVLDTDGHILTNYHVVRGFDSVEVTFSDGTTAQAQVVGRDPGNDIAVVKAAADAGELHPATLGDSSAVRTGEAVAAIGNPFGLDGTITGGIISAVGRTMPSGNDGRPIRDLLQTDAAVNPGNSGGALFNVRGEVIGINTAVENPAGNTFLGVGYAVPIDTPKRFLSRLISGETITHPRLGIAGRTLTHDEASGRGVAQGVAVLAVDAGSAAGKAGLRASQAGDADVIVAIDGQPMNTFEALAQYIDARGVEDEVTLEVRRGGDSIELKATLQAWDSSA